MKSHFSLKVSGLVIYIYIFFKNTPYRAVTKQDMLQKPWLICLGSEPQVAI